MRRKPSQIRRSMDGAACRSAPQKRESPRWVRVAQILISMMSSRRDSVALHRLEPQLRHFAVAGVVQMHRIDDEVAEAAKVGHEETVCLGLFTDDPVEVIHLFLG